MIKRFTPLLALLLSALPASGATMRVGLGLTGINTTYTYVPFDTTKAVTDPNYVKPAYVQKVDSIVDTGDVLRFMDWAQTVGSPITDWSGRSLSDTGVRGVTYETQVRFANQMHAVPWANVPTMVPVTRGDNNSYAFKQGQIFGASTAPEIKVEYGNELWNGGDQNQGTWNLQQARGNPKYTATTDTEKMAQRAWDVGFDQYQEFERGARAAGYKGKVTWEAPAFGPNQYFAFWGASFLKQSRGVDIANYNVRLGNAAYAPGSPSDISWSASDTPAQLVGKLKAFTTTYVVPWLKNNKTMAAAIGAKGVDIYEGAIGSNYDYNGGDFWLRLNSAPEMKDAEQWYVNAIAAGLDDPDAVYNQFGIGGNPWSETFGQWDAYSSIDATLASSPKAQGIIAGFNDVRATAVPEPAAASFVALVAVAGLLWRRRPFAK